MDSTEPAEPEINFDSFLKFPLFMCRVLLLDFEPSNSSSTIVKKLLYHFRTNFFKICLLSLIVGVAMMIAYLFLIATSFAKLSEVTLNIATIVLVFVKGMSTYANRNKIWILFQDLRRLFSGRTDKNSAYNVKAYLKSYHRFIQIYSGSFIIVSPVMVLPLVLYYINGTMTFKVDYWYPFDPYQPSTFLCASLWIIWIAFLNLMFLLGPESLLYVLISVLVMEFDFLKLDFMKLKNTTKIKMRSECEKLVDRHNKLFELCDKLQDIYKFAFFASFMITSVIMCFIAFQLTIASEYDAYTLYIPFITIIGGQIFLLCLFGQNLIDSSLAISDGAFEMGWEYIEDEKIKQDLTLVIVRANRAKSLSAMKFAELSLPSFTLVSFKVRREDMKFFFKFQILLSLDFNNDRFLLLIDEKCLLFELKEKKHFRCCHLIVSVISPILENVVI